MYCNGGQGVAQSYEMAFEWFTKAANQGHENAINILDAGVLGDGLRK